MRPREDISSSQNCCKSISQFSGCGAVLWPVTWTYAGNTVFYGVQVCFGRSEIVFNVHSHVGAAYLYTCLGEASCLPSVTESWIRSRDAAESQMLHSSAHGGHCVHVFLSAMGSREMCPWRRPQPWDGRRKRSLLLCLLALTCGDSSAAWRGGNSRADRVWPLDLDFNCWPTGKRASQPDSTSVSCVDTYK